MPRNKEVRFSFLAQALLLTVLFTAPMPFLLQLTKAIPLISLVLGEVSLIFLIILATMPKSQMRKITKVGAYYLGFVATSFALLSFVPFDISHKLFAFNEASLGVPSSVTVNILGIIVLNLVASLAFGLELNRHGAAVQVEAESSTGSLYELYLEDYEQGNNKEETKLGNIERALLENLHPDITSAICVDNDGNSLTSTFFQWNGMPQETLISAFTEHNSISREINGSSLCQLLLKDHHHWYMVSKYRGKYLLLQAANTNTSPLMDTGYKVFKTCEAGIK
ncbi:MAG: hypothetical protein HOA17_03610 [Candidatus Melainabacteria bacterium]|nr:hypothetical protein [Candidatus Melainabacteria bacterium]